MLHRFALFRLPHAADSISSRDRFVVIALDLGPVTVYFFRAERGWLGFAWPGAHVRTFTDTPVSRRF
jgi:hypothetical protein